MHDVASAGLGFLLAVLWFDLMFDVQARGVRGRELPAEVLDSIAAYYRRVTTDARPMNRLVAGAMLVTLGALVGEIVRGEPRVWVAWMSLALTAAAVSLAALRTVPNAVKLGSRSDAADRQSVRARAILADHLACIAAISLTLVVHVAVA